MENFTVYNPTKLFFGSQIIDKMHKNIVKYGQKALLLYGKKSAKEFGYYDMIVEQLRQARINFVEYFGIKANPILSDVINAVEVCKKEKIDFIIALGGGSVIDSAKIISVAYANELDPWQIMKYEVIPQKSVPIIAVLTLAATGTEMNGATVIQNSKTHEKIGYVSPLCFPTESYLDPNFTLSVSKEQTIYGIADMIAHSLESYFAFGTAELSDKLVASVLKEIFEVAPKLLNNLNNYDLRARVLWASTVALNGTLYSGRKSSGDWGVHSIGHVISYLFDTPHGATLSVAFPAWMKYHKNKIKYRLENLGYLLTGEDINEDETIELFEKFFKKIGAPVSLEELEICENDIPIIKKYMITNNVSGMNIKMNENDYEAILKLM
jgi:alcohol dehydrogenase YqhD (iron-dependent ADH family)